VGPRERVDLDVKAAAAPLVRPDADDAPVHQQHGRQPPLRAVDPVPPVPREHSILPARGADDVRVEAREQPDDARRRGCGGLGDVRGEHPAARAVDLDLLHLVAERPQPSSGLGGRGHPEPALELLARGGAVRAQVVAHHRGRRFLRVHGLPVAEPRPRRREPHALPFSGREAEPAAEGGRLEEVAEAAHQLVGERRVARPLGHGGGELLSGEERPVEHDRHGGDHGLRLLARQAVMAQPSGLVVARPQARERGDVARELRRREEVQRAAHGPRLHERALLPQQAIDRAARQALQPGPQRELRTRGDLRMNAAEARPRRATRRRARAARARGAPCARPGRRPTAASSCAAAS
jgi:hypothetical protein